MGRSGEAKINLLLLCWLAGTLLGLAGLTRYAATPGPAVTAPPRWPEGTSLPRDPGRPTLVMFFHPRCPCSQASIVSLERIVAHAPGRAAVTVPVLVPPGPAGDEDLAAARESLARLPDVRVVPDLGGAEARRFHAETSGTVTLYDAAGRLLFAGGVTPARGHEGDNAGSSSILEHLLQKQPANAPPSTPVFGCPLFAHGELAKRPMEKCSPETRSR